jgi:hypothetical protein
VDDEGSHGAAQGRLPHYTLGTLLAFITINAFGGGIYGIAGAEDVPTELLSGTPFRDYVIPSLILLVAVGGSSLLAAMAAFLRHRSARPAALGAGTILLVWMAMQLALIGYVSWMQPTVVALALLVLILAGLLPRTQREPECGSR